MESIIDGLLESQINAPPASQVAHGCDTRAQRGLGVFGRKQYVFGKRALPASRDGVSTAVQTKVGVTIYEAWHSRFALQI
jgi:hypothetical protein